MKKWMILWMIGIMCISLCACRPADGEGNGSLAGESELAPETETQQPETPEEAQSPVETEQEATGEGEGEEATTEETATETTEIPEEDPAIRAEAERIYVEEGLMPYMSFCFQHDILAYNYDPVDYEVPPNYLSVTMKKSHSAIGKPAPDLSAINPVEVKEVLFDPNTQPGDKFNQIFKVIINPKDNQEVLKAIKIIEQIEGVQAVEISIGSEAM